MTRPRIARAARESPTTLCLRSSWSWSCHRCSGPGSWNISFTETGEANCGYPEIPLTFDATLVIGLLDADGPDGADDDGDDQAYEYEIRIERPFGQVFFGVGSGLPVQVEASGPGWSEVTTITDLDFDNGVFLATSYYSTDECGAERILVGGGF